MPSSPTKVKNNAKPKKTAKQMASDIAIRQEQVFHAARPMMHPPLKSQVAAVDAGKSGHDTFLHSASSYLEVKDELKNVPVPDCPIIPMKNGLPARPLTPQEEKDLTLRMVFIADTRARDLLCLSQYKLAKMIARQYSKNIEPLCTDLAQEAYMGALRATETFDPFMGIRFSTYSGHWIHARIRRYLQNQKRVETNKISGTDIPIHLVSLQDVVPGGDDDLLTMECITADPNVDVENSTLTEIQAQRVRVALDKALLELGDDRAEVVAQRRLLTTDPETFRALGEEIGISREGARLIENRLISRTKEVLRRSALAG